MEGARQTPTGRFCPHHYFKGAKDFATEITIHNARENNMARESQISAEHVTNNKAVRQTLLNRGIRPESLPPAEDVKKVERRLGVGGKEGAEKSRWAGGEMSRQRKRAMRGEPQMNIDAHRCFYPCLSVSISGDESRRCKQ